MRGPQFDTTSTPSTPRPNYKCLEIANRYLQEEMEFGEAKRRIIHASKYSSFGHLILGELSLEQAHRVSQSDPSLVSTYMELARSRYRSASEDNTEPDDISLSNRLRANMRLAQANVLEYILKKQQIPELPLIQSMYKRLLGVGAHALKDNPNIYRDTHDTMLEVKGTLPEIALLALAQRHAIRDIGGEGWLPLQSFFSQDHGGDCTKKTNKPAWDMTIFTQYDLKDRLEPTYKIQTKTYLPEPVEDINGVTTVRLHPDIGLSWENTRQTLGSIIIGCQLELHDPEGSTRITEDLDKRQEKFLDIIG